MLRIASLIFALLVSWSACAQVPLTGAGKGAPGGAAYQGLGDVVALSKYWGCPRAVTAAYASGGGALCDVVDSATGLVTCTLHALPTGFVNTTECSGVGQSCQTACKVTKEYNQIANGTADKVNVTLANMPVLTFSAINGLPAPQYTAVNSQVLAISSTITQTAPVTVGAVFKRTVAAGAGYLSSTSVEIRGSSSANTAVAACGVNVNVTASDNVWHGINMLCSGVTSTSAYNIDGTYNAAQNMGTIALSAQTLQSGKSSAGIFLTGLVAETFEAVGLSPTDSASVYANQHGINGYNGAF